MIDNPPNPPDPGLVTKLASIGIGPGNTPSTEANTTIKAALQTWITKGQKMHKWQTLEQMSMDGDM